MEILKHQTLQPEDFYLLKRYLQKTLFNLTGKAPSGTANQSYVTKFQELDSGIFMTHLKKAPDPAWTCTPSGDLEVKISQN